MSSTSVEPGGLSQLSRRSFNDFAAAAMASTLGSSPGSSPGGQASGKVSKVGVDVGGRGDTEDVAEVDEVGLGGGALGEGDAAPAGLELLDGGGGVHEGSIGREGSDAELLRRGGALDVWLLVLGHELVPEFVVGVAFGDVAVAGADFLAANGLEGAAGEVVEVEVGAALVEAGAGIEDRETGELVGGKGREAAVQGLVGDSGGALGGVAARLAGRGVGGELFGE